MKNIALVTGAAGGIGAAIARKFLTHPIDCLVLVDINKEKLNRLYNQISNFSEVKVLKYECDVGNADSVREVLNYIEKEVGAPNILINCAGIGGPFHRVDQVSDDEWFSIMNTNLKSIFNFSRILLPEMKERNDGRIINIASIQGFIGSALSSTYVASKHAVIGYTRAIAAEWGLYGITCNAICPGYVDTAMGVESDSIDDYRRKVIDKTPSARLAYPDEIASMVLHLIKKESAFINGSIITIDGGLSCHLGIA